MDNFRFIKTYERHSHRYRNQQDKLLSDFFDKVTADTTDKGKHKSSCDSTDASEDDVDRGKRPASKKTKQAEPAAPHSSPTDMAGSQWMESSPPSGHHEPSPAVSHCPLFESPCDIGTESHPKKARCSRPGRRTKVMKREAKRRVLPTGQRITVRPSATVQPAATTTTGCSVTAQSTQTVAASSDYPSMETFRDLKRQSFKWSLIHKEMELSCGKSSLSMSDSFSEKKPAPSQHRERTFLPPQPWTPTGIRRRSFIKIRTPAALCSGERPQTVSSQQGEGEESGEADRSSYTSVYTWTTATLTPTPQATQTGTSVKGTERGCREDSSSSPTLVLMTAQAQDHMQSTAIHPHLHPHPLQDSPHLSPIRACPPPLQSTAIHSHLEPGHLQHTPHVSPIRGCPDDEDRHRTPCAPIHYVSPRGPRKTQSFLSLRGQRGAAPKCSTMLFASPMASAGDAPLDVSSIRMALSEAMELNEDADKDRGKDQKRQHQARAMGDRVFTSTPRSLVVSKLKWNLSSVPIPYEEDELLHPLDSSGDTVNSQEIMAASISDDSSLQLEDDQDLEPEKLEKPAHRMQSADKVEEPGGQLGEAAGGMNTAVAEGVIDADSAAVESGVADTSHTYLYTLPSYHTSAHLLPAPRTADFNRPATPGDAERSSTPRRSCQADGRGDGFEHGVSDINRDRGAGDQVEHDGNISNSKRGRQSASTHRPSVRMPGSVSYLKQDEAISHATEGFSSGGPLSAQGEARQCDIVNQGIDVCHRQRESSKEEATDWVSPCPVSCTGDREKSAITPPPHKPGLLLWIEPADSGFLDMVTNTPPDIIDVVSRTVKENKFPSLT